MTRQQLDQRTYSFRACKQAAVYARMRTTSSYSGQGEMLQRKLEPILTQPASNNKKKPNKSQLTNSLELTFVATHMIPPLVLHCLNILTFGQYVTAGWYSAHQLMMTLLSVLSPYIPLTRYQRYCLRIPFNALITIGWWEVMGFSDFALTKHSSIAGIGIGLLCTLLWVSGAKLCASKALQSKAWDPYSRHEGSEAHWIVLGRLVNSSTFTPFWEEVYDRGYLYRVFANAALKWQRTSFDQISLGHVSVAALAVAVTCFGAGHTRFQAGPLLGALFALIMHAMVFWSGSLGPAVLAHAVCNLTLGLWVIYTQDWMFW